MILARAYFKEIAGHLLMVLGGITFLVTLGAAVQASSKSQGAPIWVPLSLIPLLVGNALPYLIPVSLLTASVLTYGRMAADGEDMVLRAAGVRPVRLLGPAVLAGLLVALMVYPLSAQWLPDLYTRMRNLSYRLRFAALENTNPGASELHFRGLHLTWHGRNRNGDFQDVILYLNEQEPVGVYPGDPGVDQPKKASEKRGKNRSSVKARQKETDSEKEPSTLGLVRVRADRASMTLQERRLIFALHGMSTFSEPPQSATEEPAAWSAKTPGVTTLALDLNQLGERQDDAKKADDFRSADLRRKLQEEQLKARVIGRYRYTLWRRLSMAVAAIPLALVGAVLGWRLRRGGMLTAFAAAFAVVLGVFFPLFYLGDGLEKNGQLDALPAAWLPVAGILTVLILLGIWRRPS